MNKYIKEYFGHKCPKCGERLETKMPITKYYCSNCNETFRRAPLPPLSTAFIMSVAMNVDYYRRLGKFSIQFFGYCFIIFFIFRLIWEIVEIVIRKESPYYIWDKNNKKVERFKIK